MIFLTIIVRIGFLNVFIAAMGLYAQRVFTVIKQKKIGREVLSQVKFVIYILFFVFCVQKMFRSPCIYE